MKNVDFFFYFLMDLSYFKNKKDVIFNIIPNLHEYVLITCISFQMHEKERAFPQKQQFKKSFKKRFVNMHNYCRFFSEVLPPRSVEYKTKKKK